MANETVELVDGHYVVGLPLKDKSITMPNNRKVAEQRTLNLKGRFGRDAAFQKDYTTFMDNLISSGYAESASYKSGTMRRQGLVYHSSRCIPSQERDDPYRL